TLRVPARAEELAVNAAAAELTVAGEGGERQRVTARLLVGADGADSQIRALARIGARVEDYDQVAVVANVAADRPHRDIAYERFTRGGPLAVLPLHDGGLAVIWARSPREARELLAMDDAAYLSCLQREFGWRAGRFVGAGRRGSYPLKLTRATTTVATRAVLIGNAAQALHPVAGQGFNLGLRDAAMLAEAVTGAPGDAGSTEVCRSSMFDVVVVGGGPVGACAAALLARGAGGAALRVALLEPAPPAPLPAAAPLRTRVVALSRASERILKTAGAWSRMPPERVSAYERMRVWHESVAPDSDAVLEFDAADVGEPNLGYIAENQLLQWALLGAFAEAGGHLEPASLESLEITDAGVGVLTGRGRLAARLVVGADGAESRVREAAGIAADIAGYRQTAIIATV